jgi:probable HAF family extracellular repeat protein
MNSDVQGYVFRNGAVAFLDQCLNATDINDHGVACGMPDLEVALAIWDTHNPSQPPQPLPLPPGFTNAGPVGINNAGNVVGRCWNSTAYAAFLYRDGTSVDLNTQISAPEWQLFDANAINNAGQIVGTGFLDGQITGYILSPPNFSLDVITLPELVATLLGGVAVDGGGWVVVGHSGRPIGPREPWLELPEAKRDALLALALDEVAAFITDEKTRKAVRTALIRAAQSRIKDISAATGRGSRAPQGQRLSARSRSAGRGRGSKNEPKKGNRK